MGNLARPIGSPATSHGARKNLNFVAPEAEVDELISNLMCGCCDALLVPPLNQIPSRWVKVMIIFSSPTPKQNRMHQRRTSESESRSCDGSTFAHDPLAYHVIKPRAISRQAQQPQFLQGGLRKRTRARRGWAIRIVPSSRLIYGIDLRSMKSFSVYQIGKWLQRPTIRYKQDIWLAVSLGQLLYIYISIPFSLSLPLSTMSQSTNIVTSPSSNSRERERRPGLDSTIYTNWASLLYSGCMSWGDQYVRFLCSTYPVLTFHYLHRFDSDVRIFIFFDVISNWLSNRIPTLSSSSVCWRKTIQTSSSCIIRFARLRTLLIMKPTWGHWLTYIILGRNKD